MRPQGIRRSAADLETKAPIHDQFSIVAFPSLAHTTRREHNKKLNIKSTTVDCLKAETYQSNRGRALIVAQVDTGVFLVA